MNVIMLASECIPFVKTGGLADVVGSLPAALRRRGLDVRVMLPKYGCMTQEYQSAMAHRAYTFSSVGWRRQYAGVEELVYNGVPHYFVDNEYYFKRQGPYGYDDEPERFAFFCRAALDLLPRLGFKPDIIHCHDWHTGMVCTLLAAQYRHLPFYQKTKTVFTIHNLAYQGNFPYHVLGDLFGLEDTYFTMDRLELHGHVSFLKAGVVYADRVTTVSESYAEEIQTPAYGEGLDGLLRTRKQDLRGIVNGIDTSLYNPATDPPIVAPYSADEPAGKAVNKSYLQELLGLPVQPDVPLLAMVTRLTSQKGIDLVAAVLDEVLELDLQWVVLGTGEPRYEAMLAHAAHRYPDKMVVHLGFDDTLAHRIYAGADLFLMPSRFEPCGLAQLIALRYGTLPIVRETGGLRDTVQSYNEYTGEGNGFSFTHYNAHDMLYTLERALLFYTRRDHWSVLVRQAMTSNWGWDTSAGHYDTLYRELVGRS